MEIEFWYVWCLIWKEVEKRNTFFVKKIRLKHNLFVQSVKKGGGEGGRKKDKKDYLSNA